MCTVSHVRFFVAIEVHMPTDQPGRNGESLLLRVGEVARLLDCSPRLVWRLASEGQLPRVVLGPRCVRFRRRDVDAMIDGLTE